MTSSAQEPTPSYVLPASVFAGTAQYYARYRERCPEAVVNAVRTAFHLDGTGRLLDLGCGTGQVALPHHADAAEVVAIDIDAAMIEEGRRQAAREGITNITWFVMAAEQISPLLGRFRLITLGSSFHWMDRLLVLRRCQDLLTPAGGVAISGAPSLATIWQENRPAWEQAVAHVIRRWLGEERRAGQGAYRVQDRHETVVAQAGFRHMEQGSCQVQRTLDIDAVLGELYSTSFCSPVLLGENQARFETDLRRALLTVEPAGRVVHEQSVDWVFAWP
jgi:ubiquinone/menaquinone biosynthesis C-methylase UbiE